MKTVDSDALGVVTRALGLSGRGAQITELTDGVVDQSLAVNDLVRRGRTQAGTAGMYIGILENVHTDAETLESSIEPYLTPTGAIPPYPSPMPAGFDIWLMAASVEQKSGAGTLSAALFVNPPDATQGWGIDDSGVAVIGAIPPGPIAFWDSVVTQTREFGLQESGEPWARIGLRLIRPPRSNVEVRFSSTSTLTATFRCNILLGVFPIALGQDVLV